MTSAQLEVARESHAHGCTVCGCNDRPTAVRLMWLADLLRGRPAGATVHELAELGEVSVRTIERDLDALQRAPFRLPLYRDGWRWRVLSATTA